MTDEINPVGQQLPQGALAPQPVTPESKPFFSTQPAPVVVDPAKPIEPKKLSKEDTVKLHHQSIRDLALELHNASPSGAATISDKILAALDALNDPEAWQKAQDEAKKEEDEREAARKVIRDKHRPPVEPDKTRVTEKVA